MAEFKVTPQRLKSTSANISSINSRFNQLMESIRTDMQRMKQRWDSEAANSFINKFEALKDDFDNYSKVIMSYSKFLEATAVSYEKADKEISKATGSLFS